MLYISHLRNGSKWYFNTHSRSQCRYSKPGSPKCDAGVSAIGGQVRYNVAARDKLETDFHNVCVNLWNKRCETATRFCDRQCHHELSISSGICWATYEHWVTLLACPREGFANTVGLNTVLGSLSVRLIRVLWRTDYCWELRQNEWKRRLFMRSGALNFTYNII